MKLNDYVDATPEPWYWHKGDGLYNRGWIGTQPNGGLFIAEVDEQAERIAELEAEAAETETNAVANDPLIQRARAETANAILRDLRASIPPWQENYRHLSEDQIILLCRANGATE